MNLFFRETYNTQLQERYKNDLSTHPELWLEERLSSGPDRNRVYDISNTTSEDSLTTQSVSTIGCSQLFSRIQTQDFDAILNQIIEVWTTHFVVEIEWLSVETTELQQLYMELKSQMGDTCSPYYWLPSPDKDSSHPPPSSFGSLFSRWIIFELII
jgi:hypothetical protein